MSFSTKFNKLINSRPNTTVGVIAATIFMPVSLFMDPTGTLAMSVGSSILFGNSAIDVIGSRMKKEWKNAAGQTLQGSFLNKEFFEGREKGLIASMKEYEGATTDKQRHKALEDFHANLNTLEMFTDQVKVLAVDNVEDYRFGYEPVSFEKSLEAKPPAVKTVNIRQKAGKFGV